MYLYVLTPHAPNKCNVIFNFLTVELSVGNSHRSASMRLTTLEEDRELFVDFPLILCLWFKIQGMRTYNFFDWVSNTGWAQSHDGSISVGKTCFDPHHPRGHVFHICRIHSCTCSITSHYWQQGCPTAGIPEWCLMTTADGKGLVTDGMHCELNHCALFGLHEGS